MTYLHRVVAVGKFEQRWFYPERIEGRSYVGRFWTRRSRSKKIEPHWSKKPSRVSVLAVGFGIPDEPKPRPPRRGVEAA